MKQSFVRNWPICLWVLAVVAVTVVSLMPMHGPPAAYHFDKIAHFGAYAVLSWAVAVVFRRTSRIFAALLFLGVLGLGLEVAQMYVTGREGSFADAVANVAGIAVGYVLARRLRRRSHGAPPV